MIGTSGSPGVSSRMRLLAIRFTMPCEVNIMLSIFFCDDDPFFLSLETELMGQILQKTSAKAFIAGRASSFAEALTFFKNNPGDYLVFLDLDFGQNQPNGFDISSALKRLTGRIHIVFTSNHHEMAMDVLKSGVEPFGFLEKGTDLALLSEGLGRYLRLALRLCQDKTGQDGRTPPSVLLTVGADESVELLLSDILYLEAEKGRSHGITYHTANGSAITVIGTLNEEAGRLGGGFLRIHRSFLASKKHMISLHRGFVTLSNQEQIPCSLPMQQEVRKWLQKN